jgi:hypothetical protein
MISDACENKARRAPNGKFYGVWQGHPVCMLDGVLAYFHSERAAWDFLCQCDTESRLLDLAAAAV